MKCHHLKRSSTRQKRQRLCFTEISLYLIALALFILHFTLVSRDEQQTSFHSENKYEHDAFKTLSRTFTSSSSISSVSVSSSSSHNVATSPYAYSFIIGGIHEHRQAYLGFVYNVLIAVRLLRRLGSKADFICYLQLSDDAKLQQMPPLQLDWFHQLNISTIHLPKSNFTSFAGLMFDKFEALQLTNYRRVMYLDSDIMPLSNLDYLFQLSDPLDVDTPTPLQPNVLQASRGEPANGGLFLMEPRKGYYQRLRKVTTRQRQHYLQRQQNSTVPVQPFDKYWGWGHDFRKQGDEWHAIERNGSLWTYNGGRADQGLLYYFFKYDLQQVSIIIGSQVEAWVPGTDGKPHLASTRTQEAVFDSYAPTPLLPCLPILGDYQCNPPYRDFFHFFGRWKPWQRTFLQHNNATNRWYDLWKSELEACNQEMRLELDIPNWDTKYLPLFKESPLGYEPGRNTTSIVYKSFEVDDLVENVPITVPPIDSKYRSNEMTPYAYAFIVGSIHENKIAYKGFLFNVMISVQLLQQFGSNADYVVFVQLSPDSQLSELPSDDIRCLEAMNITVNLLSKPQLESFTDLMFDKFRIFQLTQYRRVMYLDADVIPLRNLDYLFHLSDPDFLVLPTPLLPNIMQASSGEPANGGLFIVRPYEGAWQQVQDVIEKQREDGKSLPYPNFHRGRGWGHRFRKKDMDNWHAAVKNGTNWVFHGAHADQGLLYYFFRFVLQNCSHIVGRRVENWVANASDPDHPYIGIAYDNLLMKYSDQNPPILSSPGCSRRALAGKDIPYTCYPPYRDVYHFTGRSKPWQNRFKSKWLKNKDIFSDEKNASHSAKSRSKKIWFVELQKLNEKLGLGLNFTTWNEEYLPYMEESPLGYLPQYKDNTNRIFENRTKSLELN